MASMASSTTGNACTCYATSRLPFPIPKSRVLPPQSFATTAGEYDSVHWTGRLHHISHDFLLSRLRRVATYRDERNLRFRTSSSGLVRYTLHDSSECGSEESSGIGTSGLEVYTDSRKATSTVCKNLVNQLIVAVFLASSWQLSCNEFALALESGSNSGQYETKQGKTVPTGLSSESSEKFRLSLSLDPKPQASVRWVSSSSSSDFASQVPAVSLVSNSIDASNSSNPIAEKESAAELSRPECIVTSATPVKEDVNRDSEPVTNESVVEEAWEVVNENFLDARRHSWSAEDWLKRKEDVLKRPLRSRMAAYGAIRGMLATLNDPYTRFLTPDQFLQLSKYDVTGVGLNIGEVEEDGTTSLRVLGIVLGSPAQMMGVRQGDELVAVNGTSVRGMTAFEAASLIQGPKGTLVSIQIRHGPCEEVQSLTVAREQDVRTPVFYRLERTQNNRQITGYIRLKEFNALAKRDLVTAVKRLQDAGATSFLLDLQDNPGGLVQAGIEIARLFLDGGETVIQTVGRDPSTYKSIMATGLPFTKAPLMVLVNDHTASASEIVAAALHDNCRAVLVGGRTFGKGLIQSVYELSDGSGIILTVGKYVTPGHIDLDGNGIEPDFRNTPGLSEAMDKLASCELKRKSS